MLEGVIFINRPKEIGESIEKAEILFEKKTKRIYVPEFIIEKKVGERRPRRRSQWKIGRRGGGGHEVIKNEFSFNSQM